GLRGDDVAGRLLAGQRGATFGRGLDLEPPRVHGRSSGPAGARPEFTGSTRGHDSTRHGTDVRAGAPSGGGPYRVPRGSACYGATPARVVAALSCYRGVTSGARASTRGEPEPASLSRIPYFVAGSLLRRGSVLLGLAHALTGISPHAGLACRLSRRLRH